MGTQKEPSPDLFKYGFLTVRTARILSGLSSGRVFDDESRHVIIAAKQFMDQVLNGEALISGETINFAPSKEGLKEGLHAFQYGFNALGVMRKKRLIKLNNRHDTQLVLNEIKGTLEGILCPNHITVILADKTGVKKAANFFGILAKSLCNEAPNHPYMEVNDPI